MIHFCLKACKKKTLIKLPKLKGDRIFILSSTMTQITENKDIYELFLTTIADKKFRMNIQCREKINNIPCVLICILSYFRE